VALHREVTAAGVGAAVAQDPQVLGAELFRWLSDDPLRRAAADKAGPFVWENYDWQWIARRWVGHYSRIAGSHQMSGGAGIGSNKRPL
jgi:glycosyltransferase involved in cell wall biosynthesis